MDSRGLSRAIAVAGLVCVCALGMACAALAAGGRSTSTASTPTLSTSTSTSTSTTATSTLPTSTTTSTQQVITLNPESRYVSPSQAVYGLTGTTEQETGPTGLQSWVVLPAGYTSTRCYPVLYLLHAADTVHEWLDQATLYSGLQAIVVVPGGGNGEYTNWWNGGKRSPGWESWFYDELMPQIETQFPICPQRSEHAIAGSSMGGYGAMFLAAEDPGYFGTAASFSGVIDISNPVIEYGFNIYSQVWGKPGSFYAVGHDPGSLIRNLAHTRLFVYDGNGTPVNSQDVDTGDEALIEGVMRSEATSFVSAAQAAKVPVTFVQHAGIHDQDNWNISLSDFLAANPFGSVQTSPSNWTYTTVAQAGAAWNWTYRFQKPPAGLETFTEDDGVLRGEGAGSVTMSGPSGQRFTIAMPFELRKGRLRRLTGGGGSTKLAPALAASVAVNPLHPRRSEVLQVKFTPTERLRSNQEYELDAFQPLPKCLLQHVVYFDPAKVLHTYTVSLHPGNGRGHPAGAWCKGEGTVNLEVVGLHSTGTEVGQLIGRAYFKAN